MAHRVYIGIGSNLGDRESQIRGALDRIDRLDGVRLVAVSTMHETDPVGGPPSQPMFLNAAASLDTDLTPEELIRALLRIEQDMGRVRGQRNAPRIIDLDILLYDDLVLNEPGLTVPHPRMHLRAFVLAPLLEIARNVRHPILDQTVEELWADFAASSQSS